MIEHPRGVFLSYDEQAQNLFTNQKRSYHTSMRRSSLGSRIVSQQRRNYIVSADTGAQLLQDYGLNYPSGSISIGIEIGIDRNTYTPSLTLTSPAGSEESYTVPIQYYSTDDQIQAALSEGAHKFQAKIENVEKLSEQVIQLFKIYKEKEAERLTIDFLYNPSSSSWQATKNAMEFNNSAFRTSKRQTDLWQKRIVRISSTEAEAVEHGIVYVPLAGNGNIGTIGTHISHFAFILFIGPRLTLNSKWSRSRHEYNRLLISSRWSSIQFP